MSLVKPLQSAANWGLRTWGLFFLFPSAVVLVKPSIPVPVRLLAMCACATGLAIVTRTEWRDPRRKPGMWHPLVAALYLVALSWLVPGRVFQTWEVVLWYAAGITWIGLTQEARAFWLTPFLLVTFLMTSPQPWHSETVFAGSLTVSIMTVISYFVAANLSRGREAYGRMREGVRNITVVARTGKISPRRRPSETYCSTAATALELGFSGARVAFVGAIRPVWAWECWSGQSPLDSLPDNLPERLFAVTSRWLVDRSSHGNHELFLLPLFRSDDGAYVLVADSVG